MDTNFVVACIGNSNKGYMDKEALAFAEVVKAAEVAKKEATTAENLQVAVEIIFAATCAKENVLLKYTPRERVHRG